ncbi:MAG: potassium-transporting ATPase subunit C [Pseudomonadota bacterium]|uniref:Potassium-transporting ATPase KdpC subunit n=1 Tax=Gallaecimonas pentaromativorans TaxID=584787 RepID=A0A3N1PF80_9GAMM|nr:potassium-transporting ATPase subunit C [Gallaecimonas pentaromativorans]MED5526617.1 potassium-transporting ATPase subunit C [Pseudomonadota bacterium]ROQ25951.1 K+-transporting ATPase ATPase C chain [Gallaecimonas pentaromativorans]
MNAIRTLLVLTLLLGLGYPMLVTGLGQWLFPAQANGSLIHDGAGRLIGSALIGQGFTGAGYFHSRPSATGYDGAGSGATNLPQGSAARRAFAEAQPYSHPAMLTKSASGVDPDLPLAAALEQVPRVAAARGLPAAKVQSLVLSRRQAGILGPQVVNVLLLNLALDKEPYAR